MTSKVSAILTSFIGGSTHTLAEIAAEAELALPTAHRLVAELVASRLLDRTADGRYRPTIALQKLGSSRWYVPTVQERAPWVLDDLAQVTGALSRLGGLDHLAVAYIEKRPGHTPASDFNDAARLPAHASAMGKVLLAFSPRMVAEAVIARGLRAYTPHTVTDPRRLRRVLAATRWTGMAVSWSELNTGSFALAIPVFGPRGTLAAIELSVDDPGKLKLNAQVLALAARCLSREVGSANYVNRSLWQEPAAMTALRVDGHNRAHNWLMDDVRAATG